MAEGTAITTVVTTKVMPRSGFMPLWNMWWPQTIHPKNPMLTMAMTMEW